MSKKIKNRLVIVASLLSTLLGLFLISMGITKTMTGILPIDTIISYGVILGIFPLIVGCTALAELSERASKKPRR